MIRQFLAFASLVLLIALMLFVGWIGAVMAQPLPNTARQVTTGCSDTATSKDYNATVVWRSSSACTKNQILPKCSSTNNGKWIQLVDAQSTSSTGSFILRHGGGHIQRHGGGGVLRVGSAGTGGASANPITVSATGSSVSGPTLPVAISVDRGAYVLTCDGPASAWLVTAVAAPPGTTIVTPPGGSLVLRHGGGHLARHASGSVQRHAP
jgi:hypothetical protein